MRKFILSSLISVCSMNLAAVETASYISPEKMMYDLTEEATCIAAANYLNIERVKIHYSNYASLVSEYKVPQYIKEQILTMNEKQYMHFIDRATKRYEPEILPSMLLSAYTHRCEFMNGFEARSQFDSVPPEI